MKQLRFLFISLPLASVAGAQTFHLTDLGTVGGSNSRASSINSSGQVVGYSQNSAGQLRAFLYSGGTMQDLGANGGVGSTASGINDSGMIVGDYTFATGSDPVRKGFSYTPGSGTHDIGTLGGQWNEPFGLNNLGQIVGISDTGVPNQFRAYSYNGTTYTNLGTLGGDWSYAIGVNDSGVIVGDANTAAQREDGFRYSGGVMTDLGVLPNGVGGSTAYAINAAGHIAGYSYGTVGLGFIAIGGNLTALGVLPGHGSLAHGINSADHITGGSEFITNYGFTLQVSGGHGFYWAGGTITDLNSMVDGSASGWTIVDGASINSNGLIAATAFNAAGNMHAVLLTPVPEPCSLLALSAGLGFVFRRRRARPGSEN